jgi:hypothetical protein
MKSAVMNAALFHYPEISSDYIILQLYKADSMTTGQNSEKQRKFTEIISYNVVVINPKKISIRNISSGVKTSFVGAMTPKALVIQY